MSGSHMPVRLSVQTETQQDKAEASGTTKPGLSPPVTPTVLENTNTSVANPTESLESTAQTTSIPFHYDEELELQHDPKGRPLEYGRGAWSVVYKASSRTTSTSSPLMTPPSSPAPGGRIVAVKSPVRRDAFDVLDAEALTLTRVSMVPGSERYVVPFHGYVADTHSIVMSAVPLALSTYIEDKAAIAQKQFSTKTMFDPVQGMAQWHDLARKLVAGLDWLQNTAGIVHGDIKPHNLLLRPRPGIDPESDNFSYEPLFADFSSAHSITGSSLSAEKNTGAALTALTPPFAAPELLSVSSLTSPDVAPTPASDVFSLAVTLLAAATGDLLLYPGASNMQRLVMAREGHRVIDFARSGANGSRVPKNGIVEQILTPAITKDPAQRVTPGQWLSRVETAM
ncbi:hypothetical protein FE257_000520 [Aspergillus nanangensis]|uniref:Protein kinase domain-containing protein n=1 Tax=Aspergillus nanangensis TaxID=2582783 RepID=A0AAD4CUY4_ASPNN|nr:hypothetical protein FE257_000520 [Aspergillus nanangensis]